MFKSCERCKAEFEAKSRQQRFCSQSCAASHSQTGRPSHNRRKNPTPCPHCGKPTFLIHCNRECELAVKRGNKLKAARRWAEGGPSPMTDPKAVARLLKELRGTACEQCNWNEVHTVTGLVPTQVEHIDGDCTNNAYSNLKVLCPNCHSLTPTFGALNKGRSTRVRWSKKNAAVA